MTSPVIVDHLQSWSRIFRTDQTEMVRSIWRTNRNFRTFGLNGKRPCRASRNGSTSRLLLGSITSRYSGKWARTHPSLRGGSKTWPGRRWKSSLGCFNTPANWQMFSFPAPGTLAGSSYTPRETRQNHFTVWKTYSDKEASPQSPACRHSQTTQTAAMITRAWLRTFSPISNNWFPSLFNYKCPETWTSVWIWTWPCFVCWPPSRRRIVRFGSQNTSWLNSDHSALS